MTSVLPVNYASITKHKIQNGISKIIQTQIPTEDLPFSQDKYTQWLKTFSPERAQQINEKFIYLYEWFGKKSISQWIDEDVSLYMLRTEFKNQQETQAIVSYSGAIASNALIGIPVGYKKLQAVHQYQIINKEEQENMLSVKITQENDTVYINYQTLESLSQYKHGEMPPSELKCNSSQKTFILTSFSVDKTKKSMEISIDGYLFSK